MLAIRILSGPQAGQIFPLKPGQYTIGRAPSCQIKIASSSVSKEHATILATGDKLILTDLNSSNGTFVNGVRVQNQRVSLGDKITLHELLLDVIQVPEGVSFFQGPTGEISSAPAWAGNAALRMQQAQAASAIGQSQNSSEPSSYQAPYSAQASPTPQMSANSLAHVFGNFKVYIENVAMPGVYGLVKSMPYRWALAALVAIYVLSVTALSIIPVVATTKKNIQAESIRRAKTIAHNMRDINKRFILEHNEAALDIHAAELEEGVTSAFIINAKDGTIMAPASKRGEYANKPFVNQARREERESAEYIDDTNLGVAIPITYYSADTGAQSVAAYAIVLYDTGTLAMTTAQTFSLFIETLAITLLVGAIFFYFLYKIVEQPLTVANAQLNDALREGRDDLKTDYRFPILEQLISNINSALSRIGAEPNQVTPAMVINRDVEAANIIRMMPGAALTVNAIDERVIATNTAFDRLIGGGVSLTGRPLNDIPDVALQQNLIELLPKMRANASEIAISQIPFSGASYEICGHVIIGGSEPAYFIITISEDGGAG